MVTHLSHSSKRHAARIINAKNYLIVPLASFGPFQPYPVFPKVTGNILDYLLHVNSLPSFITTSVSKTNNGNL